MPFIFLSSNTSSLFVGLFAAGLLVAGLFFAGPVVSHRRCLSSSPIVQRTRGLFIQDGSGDRFRRVARDLESQLGPDRLVEVFVIGDRAQQRNPVRRSRNPHSTNRYGRYAGSPPDQGVLHWS